MSTGKKQQQRRSPVQVKADLEKVMANAQRAVSLAELARLSNLTKSQLVTTLKAFPHVEHAVRRQVKNNAQRAGYRMAYVFDTSMLNVSQEVFFDIINKNGQFICLRPVIDELDNIAKVGTDKKAERAHLLMSRAVNLPDQYIIEDCSLRRVTKVDDAIIRYCVQNAHRVILLTADKNMTLKAKAQGVAVRYFLPVIDLPPTRQ